jgi:hypothetical protein
MKKIAISVVTMMMVTFGYAETNQGRRMMMMDRQPVSYDMSFDVNRLADKLDLDADQMEMVQVIQNCFNNEVQEAATTRGMQRRHLIHQAVRKDVQQMQRVLNDEQFGTYMMLLGVTLQNKGL